MSEFPEIFDDEPRGPAARMPQRQASRGRRRKKKSGLSQKQMMWGGIVLGVLFLAIIGSALDKGGSGPKTQSRKERVESQFSSWDGSHKGLVKAIKARMNDPGSFEHVKTGYADKGHRIFVSMTYRGKNAFGGVITSIATAWVDLDGNVLNIISQ